MPHQHTTRRQFLQRSAVAASASAIGCLTLNTAAVANAEAVDRTISVQVPPGVRQIDVLYDPTAYTAFPHVVRLDGDELLMAFRQAPLQERVRHTHPRSVITILRSYDAGETWDTENATQLAAGGGQEFAPIYLGDGVVGGLLAMHAVVPVEESQRTGIPQRHPHEYPFRCIGGFWSWSNNSGFTWQLNHNVLFAPGLQTCAPAIKLASGTLLAPCYGRFEAGSIDASSNVVFRSDDNGRTWSGPTVMAQGSSNTRDYYEPGILEVADGHLLAMHRMGRSQDKRDGLFWQNESRDGGLSWSEPIETNITSGACPRLLKLSDGRILLTFGRRYKPFGLYARLSDDGGASWGETSWLLRAMPNSNQGYSSSVELDDGRIFTACYGDNSEKVTGITGTFWNVPTE